MAAAPVLIVDPYSSGTMLAPALRDAGFGAVAVLTAPGPAPEFASSFCPGDFDAVLGPSEDASEVLLKAREIAPIAVIPGCESGVELADRLASELTPALANEPALAAARRHKGRMAEALAAHGLPTIRQVVADDPAAVEQWIVENDLTGRDLVVKPPKGGATDGVTLAPRGNGWREAMAGLLGQRNLMGVINDSVVVQEYAAGTEYVIDTFTCDGVHTINDICRYGKVRNGPHFAVYESMRFLPYDMPGHRDLIEYVRRALDALGVRFGAAHNEVMLTADGPRLIETNARLAGGGLPWTCQIATGDSVILRLVRYLTGNRPIRSDYTLERNVLVAFFIARATGVVQDVEEYGAIRELPSYCALNINVRNGDWLRQTSDLVSTKEFGWAILAHPSAEQVERDYEAIRQLESKVRIVVPDRVPP